MNSTSPTVGSLDSGVPSTLQRQIFPPCPAEQGCNIVVDTHEPPALIDALKKSGAHFVIGTLDIGDILIYRDGVPAVLIERKTWSDLRASIRDNRLGEQTARMIPLCKEANVRPIYLVEHPNVPQWEAAGDIRGLSDKLIDCTINGYVTAGIGVIRSAGITHTSDIVTWLLRRTHEGKISGFSGHGSNVHGFVAPVQCKKGANLTKRAIWLNMLQTIHGMSKSKAEQIEKHFKDPAALIVAYQQIGSNKRKREVLISELKLKGIGQALSLTLCDAFSPVL